jgi:hypothetical protein
MIPQKTLTLMATRSKKIIKSIENSTNTNKNLAKIHV